MTKTLRGARWLLLVELIINKIKRAREVRSAREGGRENEGGINDRSKVKRSPPRRAQPWEMSGERASELRGGRKKCGNEIPLGGRRTEGACVALERGSEYSRSLLQ